MTSMPKILIVDDEERFRITLAKLLSVKGFEVKTAGGGRAALKDLENEPFDIVLLDVKMPDMSGLEVLEEIRKLKNRVEVIVLTGHASVDVAVEIMRLGGYEYLLKPCPIDELTDKIESAFERKQAREERIRAEEVSRADRVS